MDPRWIFFILSSLGGALLMVLANHLALRPWRRSQSQHWTERARLLATARSVQIVAWLSIMPAVAFGWAYFFPDQDGRGWGIPIVLATWLGTYPAAREIEPAYTWGIWLRQTAWVVAVQFSLMAIFLWLLFTMPEVVQAKDGWRAALGVAAVVVIVTGIWIPWAVRLLDKPGPQDERLARLTAEAAMISGITPRHVWVGSTPLANAAAMVYIRGLMVTTRAMEILKDEELKALILHEMAHLREGVGIRLVRLVGLMSWMSLIFIRPMVHHFGSKGILLLVAGIWLVTRISRAVAHGMEKRADEAAVHGSADSGTYALALEKLYRNNQLPAVMRGGRVHPHLYDRMIAAGQTPDYPRPMPPGRLPWGSWLLLLLPLGMGILMVLSRSRN